MKKIFWGGLILLVLFLIAYPGCKKESATVTQSPKKRKYPVVDTLRPLSKAENEIASGVNTFGFNLLKEIASHHVSNSVESNKDIIFSPFSISMAFGMAVIGARNNTYREITRVFGYPDLSTEEVKKNFNSLFLILENLDDDVEFDIADSAWIKEGFKPYPEYVSSLKEYFYAEVFTECPFSTEPEKVADEINEWVSKNTNKKIPKLIDDPEAIRKAMLVLVNAIYFLGEWTDPFDPEETKQDTFHNYDGSQSTVDMMHIEHSFPYVDAQDYQAISLPYGNKKFFMTIILPKQGVDIYRFVTNEVESAFSMVLTAETRNVSFYLPKFKKRVRFPSLITYLYPLGITDAFDPYRADFSGIIPIIPGFQRFFISGVVHETYINVYEEGTEAAAATALIIGNVSAPPPPPEMKVDHPFIFLVHDVKTNSILFMGMVMNMNQKKEIE